MMTVHQKVLMAEAPEASPRTRQGLGGFAEPQLKGAARLKEEGQGGQGSMWRESGPPT